MIDQLVEACKAADTWPMNLIRKQQLNRILLRYQEQLRGYEDRLFDPKGGCVCFWEASTGEDRKFCDRKLVEILQDISLDIDSRI